MTVDAIANGSDPHAPARARPPTPPSPLPPPLLWIPTMRLKAAQMIPVSDAWRCSRVSFRFLAGVRRVCSNSRVDVAVGETDAAGVGVSPNPASPVPAVAIATRRTFDGPTVRVASCRATGADDDVRIFKSAMALICMERDRRLPWSSGSASRPTIIDIGRDGGLEGMKRPGGEEGRVGKRDGQKNATGEPPHVRDNSDRGHHPTRRCTDNRPRASRRDGDDEPYEMQAGSTRPKLES